MVNVFSFLLLTVRTGCSSSCRDGFIGETSYGLTWRHFVFSRENMCQIQLVLSRLTIISFREMWAPLEISMWLIFCSFLLSFSWAKIFRFSVS